MDRSLKLIFIFIIVSILVGVAVLSTMESTPLQTKILFSEYGYGYIITPEGVKIPILRLNVVSSQPTQGELTHICIEVENVSATEDIPIYAIGVDMQYPDNLQKEKNANLQRYGFFLLEAYDIKEGTREASYKGYVGTQGSPVILKPGEKRAVFCLPVRSIESVQGKELIIKLAQVQTKEPIEAGATEVSDEYEIDIQNVKIPLNFYPKGDPDLNFDGKTDGKDVQYLFEYWNP